MKEFKIETDRNGNTHLIEYNNDDGTILKTGSLEQCKSELINIIKSRHRITHFTFDGCDRVIEHHPDEEITMNGKEFCGF